MNRYISSKLAVFGTLLMMASVPMSAAAQDLQVTETPISYAKTVTMNSKILNKEVTFKIALPDNFDMAADSHTYPVIVAAGSHGSRFFQTLSGIVLHQGKLERMPEAIVVTMGAASDHVLTNGMWGRETLGPFGDPEALTRHLKEEVFPFLKKQYRAADYRIIIGVSGSTLYPLYTYVKHPGLFDAHLLMASADMIGMGYTKERTFIDEFVGIRKEQPDVKTQLYIGVADWDINGANDGDYVHNLDTFKHKLTPLSDDDHKFIVDVLPRTRHYEMYMKGVIAGLDMIFPFEKWNAKYRDIIKQPGSPMSNLRAHFKKLSDEYGFDIYAKAYRWNSVNSLSLLSKRQWQSGNLTEGKEMIDTAIEYYPNSNYLKELLAEYYVHVEKWQDAIDAYQSAKQLAVMHEPDMLAEYDQKIAELKKKL